MLIDMNIVDYYNKYEYTDICIFRSMYHRYLWIFEFIYDVVGLNNTYWAYCLKLVVSQVIKHTIWYRMGPPVISWFINHYNPH